MAGIPQVITEDRASGAQFIDGSLKFDSSKTQYLKRAFPSAGNQKTFTFSVWLKRASISGSFRGILTTLSADNVSNTGAWISASDEWYYFFGGQNFYSNAIARDTGWYHVVYRLDTTIASPDSDRLRVYLNGNLMSWNTSTSGSYPTLNATDLLNSAASHSIGRRDSSNEHHFDGSMSQFYFIDGQSLGPENFGYTDPLTGTWRPKKYTGAFSRSSFNNGTNWTQSLSATSGTLYAGSAAFDGDLSSRAQTANAGAGKELTFAPPAINFTTSLEVYCDQGSAVPTATWNGNTVNPGGGAWVTVYSGSGELSATYPLVINTETAAQYATLKGVRIDGEILIDNLNDSGANSFYLPMDGNTPIGKDQSGNGNDWTPMGFGGSVELPKATGAIPILNTNDAGTVAKPGVRTDSKTYTVTASGGNYYLDGALKPILNAYRGGSYTFDYTGATSHPLYLSSLPDGKHNSKAYSVEFDGTGDYLAVTGGNNYDFGTGDFTIEGYFYTTNNGGTIASSPNYHTVGNNGNWLIRISSATEVAFASYDGQGNGEYSEFNVSYQTNTWHHFAFVRSGTTLTCYIDGSSAGTLTVSKSLSDGLNGILIGKDGGNLNPDFNGKISNFRINKGTALYTSNFTPPSTTLTNVTGTTLLCCQDSNATDRPVGNSIAVNGSASASNTSPFLYDTNGYYGVNTGTSNTTKIIIPHWAPDTLYYYCSVHSGMGSSINVTTDIFKADPYAWKNVLALPLNGIKDDVCNQINSQTTNKAITVTNATAAIDSNFYAGSYNFDGAGDYITAASGSDFAFGTGDFTIEMWVYLDILRGTLWDSGAVNNDNNCAIFIDASNTHWRMRPGTDIKVAHADSGLSTGMWNHFAFVRQNGTGKTYINGKAYPNNNNTNISDVTATGARIGTLTGFGGSYDTDGKIQDVRVYKGVAKYTSDFFVGSTVPDVLPDTPSGITGKTNLTKITEGAVSFDGTNDYLTVPYSSDFVLDGDFTIECFVYFMSGSVMLDFSSSTSYTNGWQLYNQSPVFAGYSSSGNASMTSNTALSEGWNHLVVTRTISNNTARMFINGVQTVSSTNFSHTYGNDTSNALMVGAQNYSGPQAYFTGRISNLRIIKGTALYTSDFTPPSAPLTNVTNTKLLCCQSNTSATAAAVAPPNEPFSGAGGAQGGGTTSDYLKVSSSGHSDFSVDGDFTFEWWHYRAAANANNGFMWTIGDSKTSTGLELYWGTSGSSLNLYTNDSSNSVTATAATGWHHYAVVRSGNTIKVYYDGTEGVSVSNSTTFSGDVRIGAEYYNGNITGGMHGPMSQFRFVKDTAVYTSNFTAPTTALTAIANTKILTLQGSTITDASGTNKTIEVFGTVTTDIISKNGDAAATTFNPFTDDINAIRGQETGYATLNPLDKGTSSTLSDGNLKFSGVSSAHRGVRSSIRPTIKVYAEMVVYDNETGFGFATGTTGLDSSTLVSGKWVIYNNQLRSNGSSIASITTLAVGDLIQVAYDPDSNKAWIGRNNFWYDSSGSYTGNPATGANATFTISEDVFIYTHSFNAYDTSTNFGQKPFKFPPPDGFQPLNLSNVQPEKVIARPDQYVDVATWTGDGTNGSGTSNDRQVTGLGHKPDLVWCKIRTQSYTHVLWDSVRGPGVNKELQPNEANQEGSANTAASGYITEFTSDGFKTVTGTTDNDYFDRLNDTYVAWCWKAGGNKNTFNIDDVGYANASDVNMSVGALNSSVYDQRQTWSNSLASSSGFRGPEPATNAFDGSTGTVASAVDNGTITFTSPVAVPSDSTIRVWMHAGTHNVTVNGGAVQSVGSGGWVTLDYTNPSTTPFTLTFQRDTNADTGLRAVEIGGKIFVDSGVSVANVPSIAPTGCSVGTKQGFSIVKYGITGSGSYESISHGLSRAPEFGIFKSTSDNSSQWGVYYTVNGQNTNWMRFNTTDAQGTNNAGGGIVGNAFVRYTDSVVEIDHSAFASAGSAGIAYMWHSVPGLQKFGSYTGNDDANGPFIELGFKPAIVWIKCSGSDQTGNAHWIVFDTTRSEFNPSNNVFLMNENHDEYTAADGIVGIDLLSNGFKLRDDNTSRNASTTYIYCAWAEAPSINLYGGQANAR